MTKYRGNPPPDNSSYSEQHCNTTTHSDPDIPMQCTTFTVTRLADVVRTNTSTEPSTDCRSFIIDDFSVSMMHYMKECIDNGESPTIYLNELLGDRLEKQRLSSLDCMFDQGMLSVQFHQGYDCTLALPEDMFPLMRHICDRYRDTNYPLISDTADMEPEDFIRREFE